MVKEMTEQGLSATEAAAKPGVTPATARKWLGRYLAAGADGLADASSRPVRSPRAIEPGKALLIVELRRRSMLQARIAQSVGVSEATVSRVLRRAGLSRLSDLQPREPIQRYEHKEPGDLLHIDTKKLGRIERPSHRVTGNRKDSVEGAGWEYLFVAVDDHARLAFTAMHPDERKESAVQFLRDAVAYYNRLGVTIKRLLTDNGSAFRSKPFKAACQQLGIQHKFTRAYRPQTNGKAERFIQSALREWAYGWTYQNSAQRRDALHSWQHHYNWHRPHHGIGRVAPASRLPEPRHNLLTVHSYLVGKRDLIAHVLSELTSPESIVSNQHRFKDVLIGHDDLHLVLVSPADGQVLASFWPTPLNRARRWIRFRPMWRMGGPRSPERVCCGCLTTRSSRSIRCWTLGRARSPAAMPRHWRISTRRISARTAAT
jgi:transposase InsO family protein